MSQQDAGTNVKLLRDLLEKSCSKAGNDVVVDTTDLVMEVFLDTDENYSIAGYNERASSSFGEIYLGMDKGPEYDRQSTKVNEAIQRITGAEAFGLALQEARKLLAANPDANDEDISIKVQAALCRHWFDLPDEINVVELWMRDDGEINPPARCPGDFIYPSGYIFFPRSRPDYNHPMANSRANY